jgi:hypothetical protein
MSVRGQDEGSSGGSSAVTGSRPSVMAVPLFIRAAERAVTRLRRPTFNSTPSIQSLQFRGRSVSRIITARPGPSAKQPFSA